MSSYVFPLSSGVAGSRVSFAYRQRYKNGNLHKGIDLVPKSGGAPNVLATIGGTVENKGGPSGAWGNTVLIAGDDGYYHRYAHMRDPAVVSKDQRVEAGQTLGVMGSTGNSTGPHLHYEVRQAPRDESTLLDPGPVS